MFAKIFTQIFDSTIATDWQVRHVFEDFLKLADENGVVDMPVESIIRRTNVPKEIVERAIAVLEAPDSNSRTPDHEGRRLLRLYDDKEWGWVIANHAKYRTITNREELKRQNRSRVAKFKSIGGNASQEESGYVYYAVCRASNEVKIGFSLNPWSRIKELQTARPTVEIVATERGSLATEATRHEQFSQFRKSGEWFEFSVVLKNHVNSLKTSENVTTNVTTALATKSVVATAPQKQMQNQTQKKGETEFPPVIGSGGLAPSERVSLDQSVKRITARLNELKDADLPKCVEERKELKAEKSRILVLLGLKA